jgi:hypothetical protein
MGLCYACPGVDEYGHGLTARTVHMNGCCAQFALASPERRAETGLRLPGHAPREELPLPPAPQTLTVSQLAELVAELFRRATEFPDEEPPGATVWVEYGPEHTEADVQALYDLGRPYNLVLGYRRVPHPIEGSTTE